MTEKPPVTRGRVRFVEHRGVRILQVDLTGIQDSDELRREAEAVYDVARLYPPDSLLTLTNVSGVPYSLENVHILRQAAMRNKRYVRARAVVGIPPIATLSLQPFARISGRALQAFATVEEAREWLAEQG